MLKLSSRADATFWLDIVPGVRIQFRPITSAMIIAGRRAAGNVFIAADEAAKQAEETRDVAGIALTRALVHKGIVAWEGIGDADGNPIPPTPEAIDQLLDVWPVFEAIDRLYVLPAFTTDAVAEKNG